MDKESLSDLAVATIAIINDINREFGAINDYGAATRFCEDLDQIENDLRAELGSIRQRAARLRHHLRRHNEEISQKTNNAKSNEKE